MYLCVNIYLHAYVYTHTYLPFTVLPHFNIRFFQTFVEPITKIIKPVLPALLHGFPKPREHATFFNNVH